MSLSPYPKYKPSGVEWLGEVPTHWEVKRSDSMTIPVKRQIPQKMFKSIQVMHYSIPAVQDLGTGLVESGEEIESAKQVIDCSVVLVSRLNPRKATICRAEPHSKFLTIASVEFVALKPLDVDLGFLEYLVSSELFRQRLDSWIQSVTRSHQRTPPDKIHRFWNAWPQPSEQRAIAVFLDRETEKIDALVAKKRTLIERLKEERTALITHTVTRGLPSEAARATGLEPHPKLKFSGIEWLGDVPAHWDIVPISRIAETIQTGPFGSQLHAADYTEGGIPLINPVHIIAGRLIPDERSAIDESTALRLIRHRLRIGDIVMARRGEIGRCGVVGSKEAGWMCGTGSLVIRLQKCAATYYAIIFSNTGFSQLLNLQAVGTTMANLNPTIIGRMLVPAPPLPEQRAIADFLDRETEKIDTLVTKIETAIERLQEYRSALITAAVTGKIDVRE